MTIPKDKKIPAQNAPNLEQCLPDDQLEEVTGGAMPCTIPLSDIEASCDGKAIDNPGA